MRKHYRGPQGNHLGEDAAARRPLHEVKRRSHPLSVRIDEDLHRQLRAESEASGLSISAVVRLSLHQGVAAVAADRLADRLADRGAGE